MTVSLLLFYSKITMYDSNTRIKLQLNSVALVRKRAIPTERKPLVGEVSAKF
jgi:hypothetical protein